jgi:hypothetical protein
MRRMVRTSRKCLRWLPNRAVSNFWYVANSLSRPSHVRGHGLGWLSILATSEEVREDTRLILSCRQALAGAGLFV